MEANIIEKLKPIEEKIKLFPTKDDLDFMFDAIKDFIKSELELRDDKIKALEERVFALENTKESNINKPPISNFNSEVKHDQKDVLDLLVIGDSLVRHVDVNKINENGTNKLICIPGGKIQDIRRKLIDTNNSFNIQKLVLCVGSNHIPDEPPDILSRNLLEFVSDVRKHIAVLKQKSLKSILSENELSP